MNTQGRKQFDFVLRYAIPGVLVAASLFLLASPYPVLGLVPGLAVLGLLWFGRRDMVPFLFYGIVLLIPFGAYRGLGGAFSFVRLHWIFAAILAVLVSIRILVRKKFPEPLYSSRAPALIAVFFLVNILAALGSKFPMVSAEYMLLFSAAYLLVFLGVIVVDFKGFALTLPRVIIGSVFISSLLAVTGWLFHIKLFLSPNSGRATGLSPEPNNMALMNLFSLPLVVYFLLTARRLWVRLLLLLIIVVDVTAVMSTFSRGGALIMGISCLLILWEFRHRILPKNLGFLFGAIGLAAVLLLTLTPEAYMQRIHSLNRSTDDFSLRRRASYLVVARDLIPNLPLLGYGPGTFSSLYEQTELGREFKHKSSSHGKRAAHNTYIEVIIGSGIIGLAAFLALLGYSLRSFSRARRMFLIAGQENLALLTSAYRLSLIILMIYLVIASLEFHKYLLVALAASQIALHFARKSVMESDDA